MNYHKIILYLVLYVIFMDMNINDFSYFGGAKKEKHWADVAEEEAMMHKVLQEQANQQQNLSVNATAAGAGGVPEYKFFNPNKATSFTSDITTGDGPFTVTFTNTSGPEIIRYGTFVLTFGDGWTSTNPNISYLYTNTGSFSATLTSTTLYGGVSTTSTAIVISSSIPTVTASGSYVTSSGPAPVTASFTNLTVNTSCVPTTTYLIIYGDTTSASYANVTADTPISSYTHIYQSGSFTASLRATGSYAISSEYTASFYVPAPTLTAAFTFTTSSNTSGSIATFLNTINGAGGTVYNGIGTLNYNWTLGTGSFTSTANVPTPQVYTSVGPFTASLQVTESLYKIASRAERSWLLV
jgi:hypothetical protein